MDSYELETELTTVDDMFSLRHRLPGEGDPAYLIDSPGRTGGFDLDASKTNCARSTALQHLGRPTRGTEGASNMEQLKIWINNDKQYCGQ